LDKKVKTQQQQQQQQQNRKSNKNPCKHREWNTRPFAPQADALPLDQRVN